jgi:hypothetical protein
MPAACLLAANTRDGLWLNSLASGPTRRRPIARKWQRMIRPWLMISFMREFHSQKRRHEEIQRWERQDLIFVQKRVRSNSPASNCQKVAEDDKAMANDIFRERISFTEKKTWRNSEVRMTGSHVCAENQCSDVLPHSLLMLHLKLEEEKTRWGGDFVICRQSTTPKLVPDNLLSGNADMESVPLLLPPARAPLLPGLSLLLRAVAKPRPEVIELRRRQARTAHQRGHLTSE